MLNPFEIKAAILDIISKLSDVSDFNLQQVHFRTLDAQTDKKIIVKLLFKEFSAASEKNIEIIKYLLKRYGEKGELIEQLWTYIKSGITPAHVKIAALDMLRGLDKNRPYEDYEEYIDAELVNLDTGRLLNAAVANPEVQIDFLDFISSLQQPDRITLLKSLENDYSGDELANILIPVFLSAPESPEGKYALEMLGETKSQLAFHALNTLQKQDTLVKKSLATLKMAGIRQDNSALFYKELLKESKPYRFCITYPDGRGAQAVMFSRIRPDNRVQFAAAAIDDTCGVRDCFGFNEISKFEADTIIEQFYKGEKMLEVPPEALKGILEDAGKFGGMPYEYICWRNILNDIAQPVAAGAQPAGAPDFKKIMFADFMQKWFLDGEWILDAQADFDKQIDEKLDKICPELWLARLEKVAYLKELENDYVMAEAIYGVLADETLRKEFLRNILRKSVYEYYVRLNDADMIAKIEKKWIEDV